MFNFGYITKDDIKNIIEILPKSSDHLYKILIFGGSGSEKANVLLNLINNKPDIDKGST